MDQRKNAAAPHHLLVENALTALTDYRDLGFEVYMDGDEAHVWVEREALRLRAPRAGEQRRPDGGAEPDATVLVDRPYRLVRQLSERPVGTVLPAGVYGFRDDDGNVVAVHPRPGLLPALKRLVWPPAVDALRTGWRAGRCAREEAPHLRAFQEFHRALPRRQGLFHTFVTGGQLNWLVRTLSFVPADVDLVVIGSALPDYEREWLRDNVDRPFFHIDLRVDDVTAWEFLFATSEHSFGWLDVDCLVFDGELFGRLSEIAERDYVNAVWWDDIGLEFPMAKTTLQFVNAAAIAALRDAGVAVSPNYYSAPPRPRQRRPVAGRWRYGEVLTPALRSRLGDAVPADGFFATTQLFQAMARSIGFDAHPGRWYGEALHLGRAGSRARRRNPLHDALVDHVGLLGAERLPGPYRERQRLVAATLAQLGVRADETTDVVRRYLVGERNLSERAADAALRPPLATLR